MNRLIKTSIRTLKVLTAVIAVAIAHSVSAVSIDSFGASPSNTAAANDIAIQAALNATGDIYVPAGVYKVSVKFTRTGGLALKGAGPGSSVLYWEDASSHGIECTLTTDRSEFCDVRNIDFKTNDTGGTSVAFKLDGSAQLVGTAGNGTRQMAHFANVNIYGATAPSVAGWDGGIWCHETINVNLNSCYFNGTFTGSEASITSSFAFKVSSSDDGAGSVFKLDNCQAYYADRALDFNTVEGVQAHHCIFVAVNYGVYGRIAGEKKGPHLSLVDNHVNARLRGVDVEEQQQVFITENLIYQRPNASANGIGILLSNVRDGVVANNIIVRNGNTGMDFRGIVLAAGTENVQVNSNIGRDTTLVVEAQAGSIGNRVSRNDLRIVLNSAAELYADNGTDNVFGAPVYSSSNAALVVAPTNVDTELTSVSIPFVGAKQRFDVYAEVRCAKGTVGGVTDLFIDKSGGTASVTFNHSRSELSISENQAASSVARWNLVGTVAVIAPGASNTLTLALNCNSSGSLCNFTAGGAQLVLIERD